MAARRDRARVFHDRENRAAVRRAIRRHRHDLARWRRRAGGTVVEPATRMARHPRDDFSRQHVCPFDLWQFARSQHRIRSR